MGGVYARGGRLWVWFIDAEGKRKWRPTGLPLGQEKKAEEALRAVERKVSAEREVRQASEAEEVLPHKGVTIGMYGRARHKRRQAEKPQAAREDKWKLEGHIYPALENVALADFRPRHAKAFVLELRAKKGPDGQPALAPRTIRSVWSCLHALFHEAVVDELVDRNPCVLQRGVLPPAEDKNPDWRRDAVFTREELEQLLSDERIPLYRRTLNGLLFLAGLRPSEAFALRMQDYQPEVEPLGRLDVMRAYNTRDKAEKGTKTGKRRLVPVHPTLARLLATWRLSGWKAHVGELPTPGDLLVPNPEGRHLRVDDAYEDMLADQALLGWRKRRLYDSRRTFISLAQGDGASRDLLRWVTHGPRGGEVIDLYTSIPWAPICGEVAKLRVSLREGRLVQLRRASNAPFCDSDCDSPAGEVKNMNDFESRHPDLNRGPTDYEGVSSDGTSRNIAEVREEVSVVARGGGPAKTARGAATVTAGVTVLLEEAARGWALTGNADALRERLLTLLALLRGQP